MPRLPRHYSFNVAPRYGSGSPAMVDDRTAYHVAEGEIRCAIHAIEGMYGEEKKNEYHKRGLRGIVYIRYEKGKWFYIQDVLTGEIFRISNKEYAGTGWGSWHLKSHDEMQKYLWQSDESELYKIPLEPLKTDRSVLDAFDLV